MSSKTSSQVDHKDHPVYLKALKVMGSADHKEVDLGARSTAVLGKVKHADGTYTISVSVAQGSRSEVWVLNHDRISGFTNLTRQAEPKGDLDKVLEKAMKK